jgi:hypothetical protein
MVMSLRKVIKLGLYITCLISGIAIALLFNKFFDKNVSKNFNVEADTDAESTTSEVQNSGFRYTICKNQDIKSNIENLIIKDNSLEFYLNINNYYNYKKEKNVIYVFINNVQVSFSLNDNKSEKKRIFDLEPKNNCFKITINDLKVKNNENDLVLLIGEKDEDYDVTNSFEERKSNKTHFINKKVFDYTIKENNDEEYQDCVAEKNAKVSDGIYINKVIDDDMMNGSPIIKAKVDEKIQIPIIIKNQPNYNEASLILLIDDEQYKLDDKDYLNIKFDNSFPKTKLLCIETPKESGTYKLRIALCCKNNENKKRQYYMSNTINLILE